MTSQDDHKKLERRSFDTYTAVTETLSAYMEGARTGDAKLLRSLFADHANIAGIYGGDLIATGDWNQKITIWDLDGAGNVGKAIASIPTSAGGFALAARKNILVVPSSHGVAIYQRTG